MSVVPISCSRQVLLVDSAHHGGVVLERALSARGWSVTRTDTSTVLATEGISASTAVLLTLDDDDAEVFDLLLWLSSLPERPPVVLLTRRADARLLRHEVIISLGVDHVAAWPARPDQIESAIDAARRDHEREGRVP